MISQNADTLLVQILSPLPRFESFKEQIENCDRFRQFCDKNRDKINSRISKAKKDSDQLQGIEDELEIAHFLLLDNRFCVEYEERRKEKHRGQKERDPDFIVTFQDSSNQSPIKFSIEVTGIRMQDREKDYNDIMNKICRQIECTPSGLAFSIKLSSEFYDNLPLKHLEAEASKVPYEDNLVNRLKDKQEEILQFVKETINSEKSKIFSGEQGCRYTYPIRGFENELDLVLYQGSDPNETVYYSRVDFIFPHRKLCREEDPKLTHREAADIIDRILRKLEQLRDDMGNLLVIKSMSSTHELPALNGALAHIIQAEQSGNEDFFKDREKARGRKFRGIHEFQQLKKNLNALAFLEKTGRNAVKRCPLMSGWETIQPTPIPDSVLKYFEKFRRRI